MTDEAEHSVKNKILDAAEYTFAELGFNAASIRKIAAEANVNLTAIYYYFQSKEGLVQAVLERRFAKLKNEQIKNLNELYQKFNNSFIPIEAILEAMILPALKHAAQAENKELSMRLIGRFVNEPDRTIQEILTSIFKDVRVAFLNAFKKSLPGASEEDLLWGIEFIWGALSFILCNPSKIEVMTGGLCNPSDTDTVLSKLKQYFVPGFKAINKSS